MGKGQNRKISSVPIAQSNTHIVTLIYYSDTVSMDAFIITMALSASAIQHGAHLHDRRGIYRCVLLRFRGRIEIDLSYGLRCRGLCCHSRHSTQSLIDWQQARC